jgi:hypothetical protein
MFGMILFHETLGLLWWVGAAVLWAGLVVLIAGENENEKEKEDKKEI